MKFFLVYSWLMDLKVPKCEIFDLFDFNDFFVIRSIEAGDLRADTDCGPDTYHFIFVSVCAVYGSNDFV